MTVSFQKIKDFNGKKVNLYGENLDIKSSMIERVSYHPFTAILEICFATGVSYAYFNVPQDVYCELATSESKGKCFHSKIKDRFQYKQIKG